LDWLEDVEMLQKVQQFSISIDPTRKMLYFVQDFIKVPLDQSGGFLRCVTKPEASDSHGQ
jgi:hypothetical protein